MRRSIKFAALAAVLGLGACGGGTEEGSGGVTTDESRQLNEAAEMLDASPDSLVITDGTELGNGEEAAETGDLPVVDEGAVDQQ